MALPSWPVGLPYQPILDSFRVLEATRPPKWTEFEDGPPLGRKSGLGRRAKLAYKLPFDTNEYDAFRTFHEVTLADGTARFTMPVYVMASKSYVDRTVMIEKGEVQTDTFGLGFATSFTLIVFDW